MIYRFRVILDDQEDVFRDIEIEASATAEDFNNAIIQAFGFEGGEMASFYISDDEWNQGEEIALFDMSEGGDSVRIMAETALDSIVDKNERKLIYVYDFFSMWTFLIELAEIAEPQDGMSYPNLMFAHGELPDSPPDKVFEAEKEPKSDDFDFNEFDDLDDHAFDNYDDLWN
ncbi:MAG: IS1096 element passenger TnpR family protein [Flavobacteriaceae bacterium]